MSIRNIRLPPRFAATRFLKSIYKTEAKRNTMFTNGGITVLRVPVANCELT